MMQAALKLKDRRVSDGIADFAPNFVDLSDKKLKQGGTMGFILLLTVLRSLSHRKLEICGATEYHNVVVITMAQTEAAACAFSADTKKAECIVVATKGVGENTGRGKFVCLNQKPQSPLEAMEIANHISKSSGTRKLEDAPNGGNIISVGNTKSGQILDCPIKNGVAWVANTGTINGIATKCTQAQGWSTASAYGKRTYPS